MRTALLGLLCLGACAHAAARPTPVVESVARPCTVSQGDEQVAGLLASFDDMTICTPAHWKADGASAWTVGGARLAWGQAPPRTSGSGPTTTSSRGLNAAPPIDQMSFVREPVPQVVSGGVEAAAVQAPRDGGVVSWPSKARADRIQREWSEQLDGITAYFTVSVDSRGQWRTTARWSARPLGAFAEGTASTEKEAEEQLAVLRTVRRVR